MIITSSQNPLIKNTVALREPKARKAAGLTLIDGLREIERALAAGVQLQDVLYCPKLFKGRLPSGKSVVEVSAPIFEKLAYGDRLEGIIAAARTPHITLPLLKLSAAPLIVVLEAVEKPGNLGAILRTCDGAGVDAVLIGDPKTDIYNPNVIRASTGAVFTVPTVAATNEDIALFLSKKHIKTIGTFPAAKDLYTRTDLKGPLAIVLGAEDKGLSPFWQKNCRLKAKIPMKGTADSLNVSVSAAILIYEALRQRS